MSIPILTSLAGALALIFLLTASKCTSTTEFPAYKPEICTDNVDNDEDLKIDCKDSDCSEACQASIQIDSVMAPIEKDTLTLTGKHENAVSISITLTPSGVADTPVVGAQTWKVNLTQLSAPGPYKVVAVAKDAGSGTRSSTTTFTRK